MRTQGCNIQPVLIDHTTIMLPNGNHLGTILGHEHCCVRTHITKANTIIYSSRQSECARCPMKARRYPNTPIRKIRRSVHEPARDIARAVARTRLYNQSRKDRKKVEMLFAHLKRIMKLDRLRLRGPSGAHDEFVLAATAQNLRRMAKRLCPRPRTAFGTA